MKLFSLDCSAGPASCAVTEDGRLLGQSFIDVKLTHSQTLIPMAESLLNSLAVTLSDIDAFAVSAGPGSFTGVRIGISAVKGLADPGRKPCYGVSTLEAIARPLTGDIVCAVMDARCSQVYNAIFTANPFARLTPDRAIALERLGEELRRVHMTRPDWKIILAGDEAELVYAALNLPYLTVAPAPLTKQTAYGVALAATHGDTKPVDPGELRPIYLRAPSAERMLNRKEN